MSGTATKTWGDLMRFLARYHSWQVVGAAGIPKTGGAIVTCTHSLASYDLFIMRYASREVLGREAYIVGDDLMFKIPGLGQVLKDIGFIAGGREHVVDRLKAGDLLGIAPGGMRESLRGTREERHTFDWSKRRGFAWTALKAGVPIIPAVCPNSDDIYTVYSNPLTTWAHKQLKVPLPIFRGIGPTLLPRKVKLISVLGKAIYPDAAPDQFDEADVARLHKQVVDATGDLLAEALKMGDHPLGPDVRSLTH
jgi:1-acyl-sn-glycerol-3-phosphate acyltransferase